MVEALAFVGWCTALGAAFSNHLSSGALDGLVIGLTVINMIYMTGYGTNGKKY